MIAYCCVAVWVGAEESVAWIVNVNVPAREGVPLSAAVRASSERPSGTAPADTLHVYGVVPPVALSYEAYALPTIAFGSEGIVIVSVPGPLIAIVN